MIGEIRGPERDGLERDQREEGREKRQGIPAQTGQVERGGVLAAGRGKVRPASRQKGALPGPAPTPRLQPCCSLWVCVLPPPPHPLLLLAPRRGGGWESAVLAWSQAPSREGGGGGGARDPSGKGAGATAQGWGPSGSGWVQSACSCTFQRGELPTPGRPSFSQSVNTNRGTRSGPGLGSAGRSGRLDSRPGSAQSRRREAGTNGAHPPNLHS